MSEIHSCRSLLFTPGDRPERFGKAVLSGADAVILDWEDGVAPAAREQAREATLAFLAAGGHAVPVGLRINRLHTRDGLLDLLALLNGAALPAFLALPKVESAAEVGIVRAQLSARGAVPPLVAFIESAAGLERASDIAACRDMVALAFGGVDFAADIGAPCEWEAMAFARGRLVQAAAMARIGVWDVPFLATQDAAGLEAETRRVGALGFTGKLAIHPAQAAAIHRAFAPAAEKVEQARQIVAADQAAAGGPCIVAGKLVDAPVVKMARLILERHARSGSGGETGDE